MGSMIRFFKSVKARIAVQIAALFSLNMYFLRLHGICFPVLNCHSCPAAVFACPLGTITNFAMLSLIPIAVIAILGLAGIIAGRWFCGWLCPFGFLQDLLHRIPTKKFKLSHKLDFIKYALLIFLVILIPFLMPASKLNFCYLCPAGTLESAIPWRLMGVTSGYTPLFFVRMSILLGTIALAILVSRGFCRMLCPLGAILSFFNRFSLFRMKRLIEKCPDGCNICSHRCPMGLEPETEINTAECIKCVECASKKHFELGIK